MKIYTCEELDVLKKENKKILVEIGADWCPGCKTLVPVLENIETEYPDVIFGKIDIDENRECVLSLGIKSVPTVILYNGEKIINQSVGVKPLTYYRQIITDLLK